MLVYQRVTPTVVLVNKPIYELPMQRNGGQPAPSKGCSRNWDAAPDQTSIAGFVKYPNPLVNVYITMEKHHS